MSNDRFDGPDVYEQSDTYEPEGLSGGTSSTKETLNDSGAVFDDDDYDEYPSEHPRLPLPQINKKILIIGIVAFIVVFAIFIGIMIVSGNHADKVDKVVDELDSTEAPVAFTYTAQEVEDLRMAGYTGTEIEQFQKDQVNSRTLIEDSNAKQLAAQEDIIRKASSKASPEFKEMLKNTWYGLSAFNPGSDATAYSYEADTINADYELIPPRGYQLWAKVWLTSKTVIFMSLTPEEYYSLAQKGNIVVAVEYTNTGSGNVITECNLVDIKNSSGEDTTQTGTGGN